MIEALIARPRISAIRIEVFDEQSSNGPTALVAGGLSIEDATRAMIRKVRSGKYRLYSRKVNPKTGSRRNRGTVDTRDDAEAHERAVHFFKRR